MLILILPRKTGDGEVSIMGQMKKLYYALKELSERTGYSVDFLLNIWHECLEDEVSWEHFKAVTLERDW